MASKLNEDAEDVYVSENEIEEQKEFIDPVTAGAAVSLFSWFAFKAAMQGIIGYVAVKMFEPIWAWWKKEESESDTKLSEKEQKPES